VLYLPDWLLVLFFPDVEEGTDEEKAKIESSS
jgi:hypothetical protein